MIAPLENEHDRDGRIPRVGIKIGDFVTFVGSVIKLIAARVGGPMEPLCR